VSAYRFWLLVCDGCDRDYNSSSVKLRDIRHFAKIDKWQVGPGKPDLCPKCLAMQTKTAPA